MANDKYSILIIIGPSGAGKSTILNRIMEQTDKVKIHPTYTTRPKRKNEISNYNEHIFISENKFDELEKTNEFIEVIKLFGLPYRYGLKKLKLDENKVNIVMLRQSVLGLMKRHYPKSTIYQIEADYELIKDRLNERINEGDDIGSRLIIYQDEVNKGRKFASRIIKNNSLIEKASYDLMNYLKIDFANVYDTILMK